MAAKTAAPSSADQQAQLVNFNAQIRAAIANGCPEITQKIFSLSIPTGAAGQVINVPPKPVGLIKRFIVEITGTIAQAAAETLTLTPFGPANILSQIVYNDLSNVTRINTAGWHLNFLSSVRPANMRQVFGAAYTTDSPIGYGSNWTVIKAPASVTAAQPFSMFYEVPLAYSDVDLRGAVFASVVSATQNLQLTINPNFVVGSAGDPTLAVYKSSTAGNLGSLTNLNIVVYQVYMDQLPSVNGNTGFPPLDVSTIYELKNTALTGLVVGQDFPIVYANQREFLSTFVIYDNGGVLNAGTDLNYISLTAANAYNFFNVDPFVMALNTRKLLGDDFPKGVYYSETRRKPINTLQTGNMQLNLNASAVTAGASVLAGFEAMSYANVITNGASLAAS